MSISLRGESVIKSRSSAVFDHVLRADIFGDVLALLVPAAEEDFNCSFSQFCLFLRGWVVEEAFDGIIRS
jgi:hypothetical protein